MGLELRGPIRPLDKKVLVVDDDIDAARLLLTLVGRAAQEVVIATDAAEALEFARRLRFDLILSDVEMPGMTGFDLKRQLGRDPALANIPFIFVSAHADADMQLSGLRLGALDYITKPIRPDTLIARVAYCLQEPRGDDATHVWGSFDRIPCGDLLQLLELSHSSGTLFVNGSSLAGRIVLNDGHVDEAFAGDECGEDAVFRLLWLGSGTFRFEPLYLLDDTPPARRTPAIAIAVPKLLLDAAWIEDELQRLGRAAPEPDGRVLLLDPAGALACSPLPAWKDLVEREGRAPWQVREVATQLGMGVHRCRVLLGVGVASGAIAIAVVDAKAQAPSPPTPSAQRLR